MYKVRIMISIFQGMPRKIPGSYTLVAGFLISQYTCQYTSCILCVTGCLLAGAWKVCIRNFTFVAGFLISQYTCQYTSCILYETGCILAGLWKVCIRNFTFVAGFLISQYACQYISCILYETGCTLGGLWKTCVRTEFYSCGRIPSMSGHMSVYCMYTRRIKGYTECGVYGMCTDFVYLKNNAHGSMKLVCGISRGRVYAYSNLRN